MNDGKQSAICGLIHNSIPGFHIHHSIYCLGLGNHSYIQDVQLEQRSLLQLLLLVWPQRQQLGELARCEDIQDIHDIHSIH